MGAAPMGYGEGFNLGSIGSNYFHGPDGVLDRHGGFVVSTLPGWRCQRSRFCFWRFIGGPTRCTNSGAIWLVVGCLLRRNGLGHRLVCAYGACLIGLGTSAGG